MAAWPVQNQICGSGSSPDRKHDMLPTWERRMLALYPRITCKVRLAGAVEMISGMLAYGYSVLESDQLSLGLVI